MKKKDIDWIKKQQKDGLKVFNPKIDYDKDDDILAITWFPEQDYKFSIEAGDDFVFDISEDEDVKGIEIFGFMEKIKKGEGGESDERI